MLVYFSSDNAFDDDILVHRLASFRRRESHVNANLLFPFCLLEEHALHREARQEVGGELIVQNFKESLTTAFLLPSFSQKSSKKISAFFFSRGRVSSAPTSSSYNEQPAD